MLTNSSWMDLRMSSFMRDKLRSSSVPANHAGKHFSGPSLQPAHLRRSALRTQLSALTSPPPPSDIIHLGLMLRRELVERVALGFFYERGADFVPDLFHAATAATGDIPAQVQTLALDGDQDFVE